MHKIILSLFLTLGIHSLAQAEDLPFVGSRSFNFYGGKSTKLA
jgi:hypothetical protein